MQVECSYAKIVAFFRQKFARELRHRDYGAQEVLLLMVMGLHLGWSTTGEISQMLGIPKDRLYNHLKSYKIRDWRKLFHKFFDQYALDQLSALSKKSASTWSRHKVQLSIDDSVLRKHGFSLGFLGTWWSGQFHQVVNGMDVVLVSLKIGDQTIPVRFCLLSKKGRYTQRLERTSSMMEELAIQWKSAGIDIAAIPVSMDAGYTAPQLKDSLQESGFKKIVCGVKSHYKLTKKRTKSICPKLKEVIDQASISASDTDQAWAMDEKVEVFKGNSSTLGAVTAMGRWMLGKMRYAFAIGVNRKAEILRIWKTHHWIETVFKRLKDLLSWGKSRLRGNDGAYANVVIPFLTYFVLLVMQQDTGKTFEALIRDFEKWKCSDIESLFEVWEITTMDIKVRHG